MAEWLIAPVLKTGIVFNKELSRVRIPLSPFSLVESIGLFLGFGRTVAERKGHGSAIRPSQARKIDKYVPSQYL